MLKNKFIIYSILTGIFIGTSFIPFPPWASLFAFAPLWKLWTEEHSTKKIFWSGWIAQFTLTLIGFNWILLTIHDFGNLPWLLSALGLIAYCSFTNLYIPLAGVLYSFIKKRTQLNLGASLFVIATLTSLFESYVPTIFPWNFGYTLMTLPTPTYQLAEWIGFEGLSALIIYLNIFAFYIIFLPKKSFKKKVSYFALTLFVLATSTGAGSYLKQRLPQPDKSLKAGIIQANIGNLEEQYRIHGYNFRSKIINKYMELSRKEQAQHSPDFLVWPETASPVKMGPESPSLPAQQLITQLKKEGINLITGTYSSTKDGRTANSVMFVENGEYVLPYYSKTHLLAFGEYIPGSHFFPAIRKLLPQVSNFKPGKGPQVTSFLNTNFGIQICYESLFPRFTTELSQLGAEVLLNVTNDSWYGDYAEPYQHLYMTMARAIEVRRPLIRSTNTGISTVVLANGDFLEPSPMSSLWSHTYEVPYKSNPQPTFYSQFPNLFIYLKLVLLFGVILWERKRRQA